MKRIISLLLVFSLCFMFAACTQEDGVRESQDIIKEMVLDYGYYQNEAQPQIDALLTELKAADESDYERWQRIMDWWKTVNYDYPVMPGALPEGLDDSGLCLVVLGFQLNPDGSIKSELEGRLRTALDCAGQYPNAYVLCTGGGTASKNPDATEAGQMAKWLIENGLDESRIIIEDNSKTTGQNAKFSCGILTRDYPDVDKIAIVSSDYHIPWGTLLFGAQLILTGDDEKISIVSNAAYKTDHTGDTFRYQAAGLLELAEMSDTAMKIYNGKMKTPKLK